MVIAFENFRYAVIQAPNVKNILHVGRRRGSRCQTFLTQNFFNSELGPPIVCGAAPAHCELLSRSKAAQSGPTVADLDAAEQPADPERCLVLLLLSLFKSMLYLEGGIEAAQVSGLCHKEFSSPMNKFFAAVLCLSVLSPASAIANWFWSNGIECDPLDQACLVEYALAELHEANEEVSVNTFGKMLGNLWPHLDENIRQSVQTLYLERLDGDLVIRYMNIAIAGIPPDSNAMQLLSELLDNPALTGDLPLDYWGQTLADEALRSDPTATADLAIAKGQAFGEIAIDGLYRTIAWMARNDLERLETYLESHNPSSTVYFSPSTHLFRVAAELCDNGQDGKSLAEIALRDLLATRISSTERFAIPMRAVVACDGMEAAYEQLDDMFLWLNEDLERQKARGQDGIFMIQRIIRAVNDDGLAPVLVRLHDSGQNTEAEALARRLLPEAQVIISIDEDRTISIEESQVQAQLADIIAGRANASSSLDPNTALRWFTKSFVPEDHFSPADYAARAVDPILTLWPDPIAQEAADDAMALLASPSFQTNELLRLKVGIALADVENCVLAETALRELLDQIADQKSATVRVLATADYLSYLDKYDDTLPECTS